jgi:TRAP-type C4-dicarboxylate transport system substrate-binding protein
MMHRFLLAGVLVLASVAAHAQTAEWVIPTEYPATSMPGEGVKVFADAVAAETRGQIVVKPSFDAALGLKSADMIKAVQEGRVIAADAFAGALAKDHQVFLLSSLPFLATTIAEARQLYDVARPTYEKTLAGFGQKLLFSTPWPASGIWAKKPIVAPADLSGLAIRTYDATGTTVMKSSGAEAVLLSFADAMPKLRDGSVNAVLSSGDGGAGRRLWEVLPHFTEINYAMPLSLVTINRAAFDALSGEQRAAVERAASATEQHQWKLIESRLAENYARMRANGVTIATKIDPALQAGLARAAQGAIDEWAQRVGSDGAALLAEFRKRAGKS